MTEHSPSCYTAWTESKTGIPLPLYTNGKAAASVYNPEKEAVQFASLDVFKNAGFILIAGLGAQLHINELVKRYPDSRIAVVEANKASVDFIKSEKKNPNHMYSEPMYRDIADFTICTVDEIYDFLLQNYFPPADGNFCLYPLRSWAEAQPQLFERIKEECEHALADIAADVSTQARFGKIWHKNIIDNLSLYAHTDPSLRFDFFKSRFPVHKTAFIAGAGPGLELCVPFLKQRRDFYYIIATDTAYPALNACGIQSDVFVSIDPQQFSVHHIHTHIDDKTLFVCDLACSPLIPRKASACGAKILFFKNNHPLCLCAETYYALSASDSPLFPFFGSSEGTVAIAAVKFALKAGFTKIATGGADFCYTDGKAYTRGSYFDSVFGYGSTRLNGSEHLFCNLMYAKPLENAGLKNGKQCFTTSLLKAYRESFNKVCRSHPGIIFPLETANKDTVLYSAADYSYAKNGTKKESLYCENLRNFDIRGFLNFYREELKKLQKGIKTDFSSAVQTSLLPYGARFAAKNGFFDLDKIIDEIIPKFPHYR